MPSFSHDFYVHTLLRLYEDTLVCQSSREVEHGGTPQLPCSDSDPKSPITADQQQKASVVTRAGQASICGDQARQGKTDRTAGTSNVPLAKEQESTFAHPFRSCGHAGSSACLERAAVDPCIARQRIT